MASDSLSIRDVGKRAPDLTGDTGKQEKGPQIRRFSLPHIHMRCFFLLENEDFSEFIS